MKLCDLIEELQYGILAGSTLVELEDDEVSERHLKKLIVAINQALTYIHTFFRLKTNAVTVGTRPDKVVYELTSDHSRFVEPNGYILDTNFNRFQDDIISIIEIYGGDGKSYSINDIEDVDSIRLIDYATLQLPDSALSSDRVIVVYQANHVRIPLTEPRESKFEVRIPPAAMELFTSYVAYSIFTQSSEQFGVSIGQQYLQRVEMLKQELINNNSLSTSETSINIQPFLKGYY